MIGKRLFEKNYPFICPIAVVLLYIAYAANVPNNLIMQKFPDLLNVSLTLSGIALGFLGTMISAVLAVTNSKVMKFIYSQNADRLLMCYIRDTAVINLMVLLFSIILLITFSAIQSNWLIYIWLFAFSSSFFCSFRIIHLLFVLLEAVNNENRSNSNKKIYTPEVHQLKPPHEDE